MKLTIMQYKKLLKEKMKADGLTDDEKRDYCFNLQRDDTVCMEMRHAANRLFCSMVDVASFILNQIPAQRLSSKSKEKIRKVN